MRTRKRIAKVDSVAERGHSIYQRLRRKLAGQKLGRIVAIDVKSADYEVADDALVAAEQLRVRRPDAEVWFERIGFRGLVTFHGRMGVGSAT